MVAHPGVNGLPLHGSRFQLTDVLRNWFGAGGNGEAMLIASDWGNVDGIAAFGVAADAAHAAIVAPNADTSAASVVGVRSSKDDVSLPSPHMTSSCIASGDDTTSMIVPSVPCSDAVSDRARLRDVGLGGASGGNPASGCGDGVVLTCATGTLSPAVVRRMYVTASRRRDDSVAMSAYSVWRAVGYMVGVGWGRESLVCVRALFRWRAL